MKTAHLILTVALLCNVACDEQASKPEPLPAPTVTQGNGDSFLCESRVQVKCECQCDGEQISEQSGTSAL